MRLFNYICRLLLSAESLTHWVCAVEELEASHLSQRAQGLRCQLELKTGNSLNFIPSSRRHQMQREGDRLPHCLETTCCSSLLVMPMNRCHDQFSRCVGVLSIILSDIHRAATISVPTGSTLSRSSGRSCSSKPGSSATSCT